MNLWQRLFGREIARQVRAALAVHETDTDFAPPSQRDRFGAEREEVLRQALEAWRVNPLARRIVELTSQYVVGGGLSFTCRSPYAMRFLNHFWEHRLNRMSIRCTEWCDELTRTGNLFVLVSTDAAGMSYVRAVPASMIREIHSAAQDVEQPLAFVPAATPETGDPQPWQAYDERMDAPDENGRFATVMLHYAVNRPVGAQWGESDLAPLLRWLARYANWLEDRARLNRYRTAFLYVVRSRFNSEAERITRQNMLNLQAPQPGSILVVDKEEEWSVLSARLESDEAGTDGLALKKMIAAGAGVPLHFLAEPESATRTTAESAGGPTYRHFEQRQRYFLWVINDVLRVAANRRALVDRRLPRGVDFELMASDISARDNLALSMAASNLVRNLEVLRDRGLIDDAEFLRLAYKFAGEPVEIDEMLRRGSQAGAVQGKPPESEPFPAHPGEEL